MTFNQSESRSSVVPVTPEQLLMRLCELGIKTSTVDHPPLFTVEESRALRGALPGGHCKSLFLTDKKKNLWLVVALEDELIDLRRLHQRLGCGRLSFAGAGEMMRILGVTPGSVTPFGLINDRAQEVSVALDQRMMAQELLNYHPLVNVKTTAIRSEDLLIFIRACGHAPCMVNVGERAETP
ncbi:Ala-tRNA(Pro) deacylase [Azospirillaceae bacterium]